MHIPVYSWVIAMINFEAALKKPFSDAQKLMIGILLNIIPIVNWIARGYAMECSGVGSYKKSNSMPAWKNLGDFFMKGLMSVVIRLVYALPAVLVIALGAGSFIISLMSVAARTMMPLRIGRPTMIMSNVFQAILPELPKLVLIIVLALVLGLTAGYLIPMATLSYLKKNKLGDAFNVGKVIQKTCTQDYFVSWIVVCLVSAVGFVIFSWIPLIGGAAVSFVVSVMGYTLFGKVYLKKS